MIVTISYQDVLYKISECKLRFLRVPTFQMIVSLIQIQMMC